MHPLTTVVYAKNPIVGQVKTRLCRAGNGASNARFANNAYKTLLAHTLAQLAASGHVVLAVSPNARHGYLRQLAKRYQLTLQVQPRGPLGQRMRKSLRQQLKTAATVVIVGSDCPSLNDAHIKQAELVLNKHSGMYLQAATDGGYVLVAARCYEPKLFQQILWSSPQVLAQSRRQARCCKSRLHIGTALTDIDHLQDWRLARRKQQVGPLWKRQ